MMFEPSFKYLDFFMWYLLEYFTASKIYKNKYLQYLQRMIQSNFKKNCKDVL